MGLSTMMYHNIPLNVGDFIPEGNTEKASLPPYIDAFRGLTAGIKPYSRWSREDRWEYLLAIYGDTAAMPEDIVQEIWGAGVLKALSAPADCPACREHEGLDSPLCGYHESRCCHICGGIAYCKSGCP